MDIEHIKKTGVIKELKRTCEENLDSALEKIKFCQYYEAKGLLKEILPLIEELEALTNKK